MAYEQKDGGAVQDIEIFNVKAVQKILEKLQMNLIKMSNDILKKIKKKKKVRRISLNKTDDKKKNHLN